MSWLRFKCGLVREKYFLYPDRQLNLFLPPEQHPWIKPSHTLEEMPVDGKDFSSQHGAPGTDATSTTFTFTVSLVCVIQDL